MPSSSLGGRGAPQQHWRLHQESSITGGAGWGKQRASATKRNVLRNHGMPWFALCSRGMSLETHSSGCQGMQGYLPLASPLGPKSFLPGNPDSSPHPSPRATSGRPWWSGWLVADGATWTNQEVGQENTVPLPFASHGDCLDFNHGHSKEPTRGPSSQKINFALSTLDSSTKHRPLLGDCSLERVSLSSNIIFFLI